MDQGLYVTMVLHNLSKFIKANIKVTVCVFDILHLNGESLINYTLRDRRTALGRSVKNIYRRLEIHKYVEAREAIEIERSLRQVIAEASEGLVVKVRQIHQVTHCDTRYLLSKNAPRIRVAYTV